MDDVDDILAKAYSGIDPYVQRLKHDTSTAGSRIGESTHNAAATCSNTGERTPDTTTTISPERALSPSTTATTPPTTEPAPNSHMTSTPAGTTDTETYCKTCGNMHDGKEPWTLNVPIVDLRCASANGCGTCSLLIQGMKLCVPEFDNLERAWVQSSSYVGALRIQVAEGGPLGNMTEIDFYILEGTPSPWKLFSKHYATHIPLQTYSIESFRRAQHWLEICATSHTICGQNAKARLPKRILEISQRCIAATLRETNGEIENYACLSHSLGETERLNTTTSTLPIYKNGILRKALPLAFQHAIDCCIQLGLRYLWIDSLCLIQDDERDRDEEWRNMASIYQNSYITLAAARPATHLQGFFAQASFEYMAREIHYLRPDGTPCNVFVRQSIPHWNVAWDLPSEFPLLLSGEFYKQRLLAPRVLYFGPQELSWECNEDTTCSCSHLKHTPDLKSRHTRALSTTAGSTEQTSSRHLVRVAERWQEVAMEFSSLMSFNNLGGDIFPAISGIARHNKFLKGGKYLAGLWEKSLVPDLLWRVSNRGDFSPQLSLRQAPTWSWASASGGIEYDRFPRCSRQWDLGASEISFTDLLFGEEHDDLADFQYNPFVKAVGAQYVPAGPDPYGELKFGSLLLKGLLVDGRLLAERREDETSIRYSIGLVGIAEVPVHEFFADYNLTAEGLGLDKLERGNTIYCFRMCRIRKFVYSLVLRRLEGESEMYRSCVPPKFRSKTEVYQRIGLMVEDLDNVPIVPSAYTRTIKII